MRALLQADTDENCKLNLSAGFQRAASLWGADMQFVLDYLYYYKTFALRSWHNMTPAQYGCLLITIAVVGWVMMKSNR